MVKVDVDVKITNAYRYKRSNFLSIELTREQFRELDETLIITKWNEDKDHEFHFCIAKLTFVVKKEEKERIAWL